MSRLLSKRERIFNLYASNLKEYLNSIGQQKGVQQTEENFYICPLCYEIFFKAQLIENPNTNFLTLEHNPPESMEGRANILTCHTCNNKNGSSYDKLVRDLLVTESFLYSNNASLSAKFSIDGKSIRGRLLKNGNKKGIKPDSKSNPQAYKAIKDNLNTGKPMRIEHSIISPDWVDYSLGMLKIAYLKAFELFGYHFADLGNGANIRDVLQGNAAYPAPNNGVMDIFAPDDFIGVEVVIEPNELKALIITIPIRFQHDNNTVKKNIPVLLPAPFPGSWDLLKNYNKFLGKEISFKTAKYSVPTPPIMNCRDYYSMFS